jgi:hypothetical protein
VRNSPLIINFIEIIEDKKHKFDRDHHQVGWHYHYCDRKGRRSDTMLSFDTNQPDRYDDMMQINNVPLFWERHAEGGAKFTAQPHDWGNEKRRSVADALFPKVTERPLNEFRRPKDTALPLWPRNAKLSPRPANFHPAKFVLSRSIVPRLNDPTVLYQPP